MSDALPPRPSSSRVVLALDSCGAETTLALMVEEAGAPVAIREKTLAARSAGSQLAAAMREVLTDTPLEILTATVVVRGPGSFTGMRIGLSAAKALSEATGTPIVAVSRLAVLAATNGARAAALDAGRARLYLAPPGDTGTAMEEQLVSADEARDLLERGGFAEHDVVVCEAKIAVSLPLARSAAAPTAADAARYAWPRLLDRDWDDTALLDAHYLWRAEQMLRGGGAP